MTKFEKDPEMEIAREAISHDQFLNPKPEFLAKLERQHASYTLHMSVQKKSEDEESIEHSQEEKAPLAKLRLIRPQLRNVSGSSPDCSPQLNKKRTSMSEPKETQSLVKRGIKKTKKITK